MFRRCLFHSFTFPDSKLSFARYRDSSFIFSKTHVVGVSKKSWLRKGHLHKCSVRQQSLSEKVFGLAAKERL